MADARIVGSGQNQAPIKAVEPENVGPKIAFPVIVLGPSGDTQAEDRDFRKTFYDWDSDNDLTYKGEYRSATAVSGDQDCVITKYVYFANKDLKIRQTLEGSWQNHAALSWDE